MVFAFRARAVRLLALGFAGGFVDFKRAHDPSHVVGMQLFRRLRIHCPQHFVQPKLPVRFLCDFSQPQTDCLVCAFSSEVHIVANCVQIQPRSTYQHRLLSAG